MISRDDLPDTPEWRIVATDRSCEVLAAIAEHAARIRTTPRDDHIIRGEN